MAERKTDLVVLGAGPAGYVCAIRAAQLGRKVVVVEEAALGGTCLNIGCIPSKALIAAGKLLDQIRAAGEIGIEVGDPQLDLEKLVAWKEKIVGRLTGGIGQLFKFRGIERVQGRGSLVAPRTVEVELAEGGKMRLVAQDVVLATGSEPIVIPGFEPDGERIWSSTDALSPDRIPASLLVVGGGYIGLELGILYAQLGSEVCVVEALDTILPDTDPEIVKVLTRQLKKKGIKVHTGTRAAEWRPSGAGCQVTLEKGETTESLEVECVLVTVGRRPRSAGLGLEALGLSPDADGFLPVDASRLTATPHHYAIGDLSGGPMLAHKGSAEAVVAAAHLCGDPEAAFRPGAIPAVIFTQPELAEVGLNEAQAIDAGHRVAVGRFPFAASGRAMTLRETGGMVKVVACAETDRLLGVQMVGPEVTELIAEAALAVENQLTARDLALTIHAHPTLPECLMEAAEAIHGHAIHLAK